MARVALIGDNSVEYINALIDIWNNGDCAVLIDWKVPFQTAYEMMKEAEANKEADEKRKEEVNVKNDADSMIFSTEKAIKDLGDKVDSKDKEEAENKIKELKEAMDKNDIDDIKKKTESLNEVAMKLATKVYEEAQKNNQAANQNASTTESNEEKKNDDGVEEASYEEK